MKYLITGTDYLAAHPGFHLVGQDENLRRLSSILMRSKAASVLLVGPGGVGATALCMGLQEAKGIDETPFDIVAKRLFWLDSDGLFSGGNPNEINKAWQTMVGELRRTPESILFIEDVKDFIEGARNSGCPHFVNGLASMVKNGESQVVLECRDEDVAFVIKAHSDFKQYFTMFEVTEPAGEELSLIVNSNAERLSKHHRIKISQAAVDSAIELTTKYRTKDPSLSRAQPERAANLLDRALATYRLFAHRDTDPEVSRKVRATFKEMRSAEVAIAKLWEELDKKQEEENSLRKQGDFSNEMAAAGFDSQAVAEIKKKIKTYEDIVAAERKEFDALTANLNDGLELTDAMVMAEFSRISGIPTSKLGQDEREKLRSLGSDLTARVFGQDHAMGQLANAIKVAKVGGRHGEKPVASFMFLGSSGVGKTETAKALASIMGMDLLTLHMAEFMEKHSVARLIGAPPGYEGFERGGFLTNEIRRNGNRIVLFDEIEKAHQDVFNILLGILSEGQLDDTAGLRARFADAIILVTSNVGQSYFLDASMSPAQAKELALIDLQKPVAEGGAAFRPEVLNRFAGRQNIVTFNTLPLDVIERIVRREVDTLDRVYLDKGIKTVMPDDDLKEFCAAHYDPRVGARGLPGYIEAMLEPVIVNTILDNPDFHGTVEVGYQGGKFSTNLVSN